MKAVIPLCSLAIFALALIRAEYVNVRVSVECTSLLPAFHTQELGVDLTDMSRRRPNIKRSGQRARSPVLEFTCKDGQTWTNKNYEDPTKSRTYQVPDQLDLMPSVVSRFRSSSRCFSNSGNLRRALYEDVGDWEKLPLGSFTSTSGPSYTLAIPDNARCITQLQRNIYKFKASTKRSASDSLDPDFKSLAERVNGTGDDPLYLLYNYGTSYWRRASYGNAIHLYVITHQQFSDSVSTVQAALDSFNRGSDGQLGSWIKRKVEKAGSGPATVFVRASSPVPWDKDDIYMIYGEAEFLGKVFRPQLKNLTAAIETYVRKAGFEKDWRGDWKYKSSAD